MGKKEELALKEANDELLNNVWKEAKEKKLDSAKLVEEIITGVPSKDVDIKDLKPTKNVKVKNEINFDEYVFDEDDDESEEYDYDNVPYDMVPLPSKGKIYKNVKPRIAVAYLNASDEDLITSPNLYLDGKIFDTLLRRKIMDKNIKPENLCNGDRNAIIVWLRASGYGELFPVNATDPVTGEIFETTINLSKLKIKELELTPDENGLFDFKLPKSGDNIKFRFMTHKDDVGYSKLLSTLNPKIKKQTINNNYNSIKNIIDNDKSIGITKRTELLNHLNYIKEFVDSIDDGDNEIYLRNITYILDRTIVSIDGNSDRKFIQKYVSMMPVADSVAFRRYLNQNTPDVDFNTTVERPGSLGGGSINTFLELDHTIFLDFA